LIPREEESGFELVEIFGRIEWLEWIVGSDVTATSSEYRDDNISGVLTEAGDGHGEVFISRSDHCLVALI